MDKDYNLITNMNKILLNMNQKMINLPVLKQNIEYIYDLLYEPVPKTFLINTIVYLVYSVLF